MPESVTYVPGMNCYPSVRKGSTHLRFRRCAQHVFESGSKSIASPEPSASCECLARSRLRLSSSCASKRIHNSRMLLVLRDTFDRAPRFLGESF